MNHLVTQGFILGENGEKFYMSAVGMEGFLSSSIFWLGTGQLVLKEGFVILSNPTAVFVLYTQYHPPEGFFKVL